MMSASKQHLKFATAPSSKAALVAAITERDARKCELEAAKAAIEAAFQKKWDVEARLEVLRKTKAEASNAGELFVASVAAGQPCGVDLLERAQSSADEDALEHEIDVWLRARKEVEASIPDKERDLLYANSNVDGAVRDAVKASNVISRLLDGLADLHEEFDRRRAALTFLRRRGAIGEQDLPAVLAAIGRPLLGDNHPVYKQWSDTFERLRCDADASLPV